MPDSDKRGGDKSLARRTALFRSNISDATLPRKAWDFGFLVGFVSSSVFALLVTFYFEYLQLRNVVSEVGARILLWITWFLSNACIVVVVYNLRNASTLRRWVESACYCVMTFAILFGVDRWAIRDDVSFIYALPFGGVNVIGKEGVMWLFEIEHRGSQDTLGVSMELRDMDRIANRGNAGPRAGDGGETMLRSFDRINAGDDTVGGPPTFSWLSLRPSNLSVRIDFSYGGRGRIAQDLRFVTLPSGARAIATRVTNKTTNKTLVECRDRDFPASAEYSRWLGTCSPKAFQERP